MKRNATIFVSTLFLLNSLASPARPCTTTSSASPAPTVTFTAEEADSIQAALVGQQARLRLLQADLDECREIAAIDSANAAAALRAEHRPLWKKVLEHPILWFSVGAYLGVQAGR